MVDDTIFEAGSLSKPVFAYAALKLCDRGVLSLDTPLTRYSTIRHVDSTQCSTFESGIRICATDCSDFMKARLLKPFGMSSSSYRWNDDYEKRAAQRHDESGHVRQPRRRADGPGIARYGAVGGLHSTAVEFARFLFEVLDPKPLNHSGDNPGFKAWVLASVPRKSGWVAFVNGDNALPIVLALLDTKSPLHGLFV